MTVFTANFKHGTITRTSREFNDRIDFYNWICKNKLGLKYGKLDSIDVRFIPDVDSSYPY